MSEFGAGIVCKCRRCDKEFRVLRRTGEAPQFAYWHAKDFYGPDLGIHFEIYVIPDRDMCPECTNEIAVRGVLEMDFENCPFILEKPK